MSPVRDSIGFFDHCAGPLSASADYSRNTVLCKKGGCGDGTDPEKVRKQEPAISRVLSWTTIHLGRPSPIASSDLPGSPLGAGGAGISLRTPLFGLAPGGVYRAAACYQPRGALLPHLFTLTGAQCALRRFVFCGTFHGLSPSRRYLAPCPMEPGLSSEIAPKGDPAVVWPTPTFSNRLFYNNDLQSGQIIAGHLL